MFVLRPLFLLLAALHGFAADPPVFTFQEPHMGTLWTLKCAAPDEARAQAAAKDVFARIAALDKSLSDYDPVSELSRLSATAGSGRAITVSGDLFTMLALSQRAAAESDGLFDITIGPCVQLWRTSKKTRRLPPDDALATARAATGWQHLVLDESARTALLQKPNMRLDLGGIAKGWAQDEALRVLKEKHSLTSAMLDAGGAVATLAPPPGRDAWHVALQKMSPDDPGPAMVLRVKEAAVATAGDLHQYVRIGDRSFSHIIDPATGLGMETRDLATVVAPGATLADTLDTICCLLGPDKAIEFLSAKHPDVHARISRVDTAGTLTVRETPGFAALVVKPGAPK